MCQHPALIHNHDIATASMSKSCLLSPFEASLRAALFSSYLHDIRGRGGVNVGAKSGVDL